jgi:hypothetical protein
MVTKFDMQKSLRFLLGIFTMVLLIWGCKKDNPTCDGSDPSYDSDIKSIIDANCASSNCHPSYSTYSGLESILDNGSFKEEVLDKQKMPRGKNLSRDQLNKLQCWVENGYKENP